MVAVVSSRRKRSGSDLPRYIRHPSFMKDGAEAAYGVMLTADEFGEDSGRHMLDEVTRDCARRMHYAAYRWETAATARKRLYWRHRYFTLRDRIALGNRKLIYRAVHKWRSAGYEADDLIGECQLVLIRVVATYNPWLGIRFSTFAFTCLTRALSRLWTKITADWNRHPLFLEQLAKADLSEDRELSARVRWEPLEEFFRDDNSLLSDREKIVLRRRYGLCSQPSKATLEILGRELGLSKERVRQLEKGALEKLRRALGVLRG